jgi:hypothetical protein
MPTRNGTTAKPGLAKEYADGMRGSEALRLTRSRPPTQPREQEP